jgi:hypothetical protein
MKTAADKEQGWKLKQRKRRKQPNCNDKRLTSKCRRCGQMNPHFIFFLSSINRIIMKNDCPAASDYLTAFPA